MSKNLLLLTGLLAIQGLFLAQKEEINSYHEKYVKAASLTEKASISLDFINSDYSYQQMDTFFINRHQELLRRGSESKDVFVTNVARLSLAMNYLAGQKVQESLSFIERIGNSFYEKGDLKSHYHALQTNAKALMLKGSYTEGLEKVKMMEQLKGRLPNWNNTVLINELKGYAYLNLGKRKAAEACFKTYIADAERIQKNAIIANAYARLGELYQNDERYDEAEVNFIKSAEAALKSGLETQVGSAKTSLAIIEYYRGNFDSAEELFQEAYEVQKDSGKKLSICDALFNVGVFHFEKGDHQKAIAPYTEMLRIARENQLAQKQMEVLLEFAHLYDAMGNSKKAITYYEEYITLKDEIQAKEVGENDNFYSDYAAISIFEQKKETERLQEELTKSDKSFNFLMYSLLLSILVFSGLSGLTFHYYRKSRKINSASED